MTITVPTLPDLSGPDLSGLGDTPHQGYTRDPGGQTYTVQMPEGWVSPATVAREAAMQTAARLAVGPLLADETLTGGEIQVLAALYDAWEPGTAYALGDVVSHDAALWEVRQAHTSQVGWEPGQVLALFHRYRGADEGDEPQPWQTQTPYAVGDLVTYEGQTYRCIQAHTSQAGWTPSAVPSLWTLTEE